MSVPATAPTPDDVARAKELARRLIETSEENGPDADRARAELAEVSHVVSDLIADELCRAMDEDALRVCGVYSNHVIPYWFDSGRQKMVAKLTELSEAEPVLGSFIMVLNTLQVRKDELEQAGLGRRILSCYGRAWVIGFVWIPVVFAAIAVATVPSTPFRIAMSAGIVVALALVLAIEAWRKRCPACDRWLGGMPVGLRHTGSFTESVAVETARGTEHVSRTAHGYATLLCCVHCGKRWEA